MKRIVPLLLFLPLLLAPSCPTSKFDIVMERDPEGGVRRRLEIWTGGDEEKEPATEAVEAAAEAYGSPSENLLGKRLSFAGKFKDELPADLQHDRFRNFAVYAVNDDALGTLYTYVERMPGLSEPDEVVRAVEKTVDTAVRILADYFRDHPDLRQTPSKRDKLVEFLETDFRQDALNTLFVSWFALGRIMDSEGHKNALAEVAVPAAIARQEAFQQQEVLRIASHLVERGYLNPEEMTAIGDEFRFEKLLRGVLRRFAVAFGKKPSDELPPFLARLGSDGELERMFESGLLSMGMSKDEFAEMVRPLWFAGVIPTNGKVVWRGCGKPLDTNGTWDAKSGEVAWETEAADGAVFPPVLFAVWVEPNTKAQKKNFGKVVLNDESLQEYIVWRSNLTDEQAEEWDNLLQRLTPGPGLVAHLTDFQFLHSNEPAPAPGQAQAGQPEPVKGAQLILVGLKNTEP